MRKAHLQVKQLPGGFNPTNYAIEAVTLADKTILLTYATNLAEDNCKG